MCLHGDDVRSLMATFTQLGHSFVADCLHEMRLTVVTDDGLVDWL